MIDEQIINGFADRIKNIAVFAPLIDLRQRTKYKYSMLELGLSVLLFILEYMLKGEKGCTYEDIANFLRELIHRQYKETITYDTALEISYYLVRENLLNRGQFHTFSYMNYTTGEAEEYQFYLLELADYEIKEKVVRLKLSLVGLELLFKTKEFYNELQISISQLYLRQQIQRGIFDGALRSVDELALAVKNEKARIRHLEEQIIRDVLNVTRESEFEKQIERVNDQLEREKRVFAELKELIEFTLDEYHTGKLTAREEQAVEKIRKVYRKLIDIIHDHESLFTDKLRLQQLMYNSIESMILNTFNTKINFQTEILQQVVKKNLDLNNLKLIIDPLFSPKRNPHFHPGKVFLEQPLKRTAELDYEEMQRLDEEMIRQEEERERELKAQKEKHLEYYLTMILKSLVVQDELTLRQILNQLKSDDPEQYYELINRLDFYPFIIQLHQMGVIPLLTRASFQGPILLEFPRILVKIVEENPEIFALKGFELIATDKVIRLPNGYVISDFIIKRGIPDGMA